MRLTYYRFTYPDGYFYISSTTSKSIDSYLRGKHKYLIKDHKELNFSLFCFEDLKIEVKDDFSSEEDLKDFEKKEIKKYFKKTLFVLTNQLRQFV